MESWTEWTDPEFNWSDGVNEVDLDLNKLKVDEAQILFRIARNEFTDDEATVSLFWKNDDCVNCPYKKLAEAGRGALMPLTLDVSRNADFVISTRQNLPLYVPESDFDNDVETFVWKKNNLDLGQFGVYMFDVGNEPFQLPTQPPLDETTAPGGAPPAETTAAPAEQTVAPGDVIPPTTTVVPPNLPAEVVFKTLKNPVNISTTLIFITIIFIAIYWLCKGLNKLWRRWTLAYKQRNMELQVELDVTAPIETGEIPLNGDRKNRPMTIEIFRGMAIILMIFINYGGGHYWWMKPATWNGLHVGDFYMPMMQFILGVFIAYALDFQLNANFKTEVIVLNIIKRSVGLFLAGLFVQTIDGATFETLRIPGLWQRLAFTYLVVALVNLILHEEYAPRQIIGGTKNPTEEVLQIARYTFADFIVLWKQWIVMLFILAAYVLTIFVFEVPDCGHGYFGPGGIHEDSEFQNCTGGVTGLVDRFVFGEIHLAQNSTVQKVYDSLTFDDANILGTMPAIVQTFIGVQCGTIFLIYKHPLQRIARWFVWAVVMTAATVGMSWLSWDDSLIPINRNLYSLSFVTATTAFSFLLIIVIYVLAELLHFCKDFWKIFRYPGRNPLFLFLAHLIFYKMWPFHFGFEVMNTHFVLLFEACYATTFWILIALLLNRKRMYVSV